MAGTDTNSACYTILRLAKVDRTFSAAFFIFEKKRFTATFLKIFAGDKGRFKEGGGQLSELWLPLLLPD